MPTPRLEAALRHISATADTLSPQEFINVCADALGVARHEYDGTCKPHYSLMEVQSMLDGSRVLLKDAMLAGAMLNETLNPLLDWNPREKSNRRKQWQAAEDEIGKFLAPPEGR